MKHVTKTHKFLGNWLEEGGTMNAHINELERKGEGKVNEMGKMTREENLGIMSIQPGILDENR